MKNYEVSATSTGPTEWLNVDFRGSSIHIFTVVIDMPEGSLYPTPVMAYGKNEVFVGRIRRDHSQPKTLNLWRVSDNLRKGAATSAVQIAEYLLKKGLAGKA